MSNANNAGSIWQIALQGVCDSDLFSGKLRRIDASMDIAVVRVRLSDGRVFEGYSAPLVDDGQAFGRMWSFRDVTATCRVEDYLKRTKEEAEACSRAKNKFLANMSHEIRTPLNGVIGMLQLLEMTEMDDEQREYMRMASQSSWRLSSLLNDVLELSKVEAGALQVVSRNFDSHGLIDSIREMFEPKAREKHIGFNITHDHCMPRRLVGDDIRLKQILVNLLGNALRFTEQGQVKLDVSFLHYGKEGQGRLLFTVTDTGEGIQDHMIGSIFSSFRQGDTSITRKHQGAGLGLALVKRLVKLMGGNIGVDSEPGCGSTFYVSLPIGCASARPCTASCDRDLMVEHARRRKILVVEDELINRIYLLKLLEKKGYQVQSADNGETALKALQRDAFDCVLMDVQMPVMDGLEATSIIRRSPQFKHCANIPIIALTAHALKGDREKMLESGMSGYVAKPLDFQELTHVMAELCESGEPTCLGCGRCTGSTSGLDCDRPATL